MASTNDFHHTKLNLGTRQIRLLRIKAELSEGLISCTLDVYPVIRENAHIALSYAWGPPPAVATILVNDGAFQIRQNLYDFLEVARQRDIGALFWIDQICIDQQNIEERNHQIKLMGNIYRRASHVVAWLGKSADDDALIDSSLRLIHKKRSRNRKQLGKKKIITSFFNRSYWSRLWVVQEWKLAKAVILFCGEHQIDGRTMGAFMKAYLAGRVDGSIISERAIMLLTGESWRLADLSFMYQAEATIPVPRRLLRFQWSSLEVVTNLRNLVWMHCGAECGDPRDKIYGLLGVAAMEADEVITPYDADYNKTVEDGFWEFFQLVIFDHVQTEYLDNGIFYVTWTQDWSLQWNHYGSRIMGAMGVQCINLAKRIEDIAQNSFQVVEKYDCAAKRALSQTMTGRLVGPRQLTVVRKPRVKK
ncbi:heterokaryon incompatibility protein-domain-containing protein [Paraphoma chrysanthemicola]|nr:heterokaryon incompatibility protein-domain-containing protein [Paraphoma chrysanthemicola]